MPAHAQRSVGSAAAVARSAVIGHRRAAQKHHRAVQMHHWEAMDL